MSRENGQRWVREIPGERFRYHVESWESPARPHVVDLLAFEGRGACSCKNWSTVRRPRMKQGITRGILCVHVEAARDHFLNQLLPRVARSLADSTDGD